MKKMKKLLSVLLAMIMAFSCFSVAGSAYENYKDLTTTSIYNSNDDPVSYLYTDEQRFSWLTDTLNDLLKGLNINIKQSIVIDTIVLDLRSLDALFSSFYGLRNYLNYLGGLLGELGDLDFTALQRNNFKVADAGNAQLVFEYLLQFIETNAVDIGNIIEDGEIDLGLVGNFVDLSAVSDLLGDLPGMIGGLVYGLGDRQLPNGIGDDPNYLNDPLWDTLETAERPTLDSMVPKIVISLLAAPKNAVNITDKAQNTISANPSAYGIDDSYIHEEVLEDGVTKNYYVYATWVPEATDASGNVVKAHWNYTVDSQKEEEDKQYITHWDESSSLLKGVSADRFAAALDLTGKDLYTMVEGMLAWAYDAFAGHNLDGQLRATLMQFCGAVNVGESDETIQAQLKAVMDSYKLMEEDARFDKQVLRDVFKNSLGLAGNYNFMYIALNEDGTVDTEANINDKPDNLYYVVEWDSKYEYYHVDFTDVGNFFDLMDWEYQAPMWSELMTTVGWTTGNSVLQYINNIVGAILGTALKGSYTNDAGTVYKLDWTTSTDNNALANNLTKLAKMIIQVDTVKLFGTAYTLPTGFANFTLEQVLVELASVIVPNLMPAFVLPETVTTVEEIAVYALREFMAEIMPHTGASWDAAIATALKASDKNAAFFDMLLDMGVSIGVYYLINLIGYGTGTYDAKTIDEYVLTGLGAGNWKDKLNLVIDWVISKYVSRLKTNIAKTYPDAMNGTDPVAKLSAVFSTLLPSFVKIAGMNDETYSINLQIFVDNLAKLLNGDFASLANCLLRKSSGTSGNMTAINAIGTLLVELFGGLGFNGKSVTVSNWSNLKGLFDNAMATSTPLQTLIGAYGSNVALGDLAGYLLSCLAQTRSIWLYDFMIILTSFVGGYTQTITNAGTTADGVLPAYTGSNTFTINYDFMLNTSGVRTYFNNGRYGTGTGKQDGGYKIKVTGASVLNAKGTTVATGTVNTNTFNANEKIPVTITVNDAPALPETWAVKTTYVVTNPDGSVAKEATNTKNFIASELLNDSLSYTSATTTDSYDTSGKSGSLIRPTSYQAVTSINAKYFWTNTYISELESLSKIDETTILLEDHSTETTTGSNPAYHTMFALTAGTATVTQNGSAIENSWITNNVAATAQSEATFDNPRSNIGKGTGTFLKFNSDSNATRGDYDADFTTFSVTITPGIKYDFAQLGNTGSFSYTFTHTSGTSDGGTDNKSVGAINTYVTLYNSYNLEKVLSDALAAGRVRDDYPETAEVNTAWALYQNALNYASTQMYGNWVASSFAADHQKVVSALPYGIPTDVDGVAYEGYENTSATVSTFMYAADLLESAIAKLNDAAGVEEEEEEELVIQILPSDPASPFYNLYLALKEADAEGLKHHNNVLYRWFNYSDAREGLRKALAAVTPPSAVANNTLVGVALDNDGINGVINAISDANVKAIAQNLVKAPTQEDIDAAIKANMEFALPAAALAAEDLYAYAETLQHYVDEMNINKTRFIAKYDANQYYFLEDAINKFGGEVAANYSVESYAEYKEALDAANEALTAAKSNTSNQYDIFSTRYNLLVAYKALVPAGEDMVLTELDALMAQANDIFANMTNGVDTSVDVNEDGVIDEADDALAYEQLLLAMGYPVEYKAADAKEATTYYIGGEYTGAYAQSLRGKELNLKKYVWVDEIEARLQAALDNFKSAAVEFVGKENNGTTGQVFTTSPEDAEKATGYVYGIEVGTEDVKEFFTTNNTGSIEVTTGEATATNGTGALITVKDLNGKVVGEYTLIVYGDVNGDGLINNLDKASVSSYALGTKTAISTDATLLAGDVNGDNAVNNLDKASVSSYALGTKTAISQTPAA